MTTRRSSVSVPRGRALERAGSGDEPEPGDHEPDEPDEPDEPEPRPSEPPPGLPSPDQDPEIVPLPEPSPAPSPTPPTVPDRELPHFIDPVALGLRSRPTPVDWRS